MKIHRLPTMTATLEILTAYQVPVHSVLDVGVQSGTEPLMSVFPHLKHQLFEPVDLYIPTIEEAYTNIDHRIHHVAVSDSDGEAWQVHMSVDNSGCVTHSQISDHKVTVEEEPRLVECSPVNRKRLDTLTKGLDEPEPWLLKVDVDGHELPVLTGSAATLEKCSVVVIEAPLPSLVERAVFLQNHGFILFDIVDLAYYYKTLSQVDLVFVSRKIAAENEHLRPWQTRVFDWNQWEPLDHGFFRSLAKQA